MLKKVLLSIVVLLLIPSLAWSLEVYRDDDRFLDIGFWGQAWFQSVEDGKDKDGDGINETDLNDFLVRRAYMSIKGTATPLLDFFVHYSLDRAGQDGAVGRNRDIELRDGWMRVKLVDEAVMLNLGRMYVPITRTPSTKSLMMIDLDWTQGGVRGGSFYPSATCNRDDGAMLWGNLMDDKLRYRLMIAEGLEGDRNPEDNLRYTGQVSVSLLEPEKGYFNPQTHLGKKNVLSLLASFDTQEDLMLGGRKKDYTAWTAEVHYDQQVGNGTGVTVEAVYADIENGPNGINFTRMAPGDDADIISVKAGYIFSNNLQPVVHYEKLDVENKDDTDIYGVGLNYFVKGHANKICLDVTQVDQEDETYDMKDHLVVTVQIAVGF